MEARHVKNKRPGISEKLNIATQNVREVGTKDMEPKTADTRKKRSNCSHYRDQEETGRNKNLDNYSIRFFSGVLQSTEQELE